MDEFNSTMKEILAQTNTGKRIIADILEDIKGDIKNEDFETSLTERRTETTEENSNDDLIDDPRDLDDFNLEDYL